MGIHKVNLCAENQLLEDWFINGDEAARDIIWQAIAEVRPDLLPVPEDRSTSAPGHLSLASELPS